MAEPYPNPPPSAWHAARAGDAAATAGAPVEMAARGTHARVLEVLARYVPPASGASVLDIGAGTGALSARLHAAGYRVSACDLYPEAFRVREIQCRAVDPGGTLPYADASVEAVLAVELLEHIENHERLFAEARRVLTPGGLLLFTTPNVLSLKSRVSFLLTGYPYSFPTLDPEVLDPVDQHITPFSLDRYRWRLNQSGFAFVAAAVDKYQRSSRWLLFLAPLIRLVNRGAARRSESVRLQNSMPLLLGRKLFVVARRR